MLEMMGDAPEALGQMLVDAVRARNASLVNNLLRRGFLYGKYTKNLSPEERVWMQAVILDPDED